MLRIPRVRHLMPRALRVTRVHGQRPERRRIQAYRTVTAGQAEPERVMFADGRQTVRARLHLILVAQQGEQVEIHAVIDLHMPVHAGEHAGGGGPTMRLVAVQLVLEHARRGTAAPGRVQRDPLLDRPAQSCGGRYGQRRGEPFTTFGDDIHDRLAGRHAMMSRNDRVDRADHPVVNQFERARKHG